MARCGAAASPFSLMVIKSGAVLALTPMGRERSPKERQIAASPAVPATSRIHRSPLPSAAVRPPKGDDWLHVPIGMAFASRSSKTAPASVSIRATVPNAPTGCRAWSRPSPSCPRNQPSSTASSASSNPAAPRTFTGLWRRANRGKLFEGNRKPAPTLTDDQTVLIRKRQELSRVRERLQDPDLRPGIARELRTHVAVLETEIAELQGGN